MPSIKAQWRWKCCIFIFIGVFHITLLHYIHSQFCLMNTCRSVFESWRAFHKEKQVTVWDWLHQDFQWCNCYECQTPLGTVADSTAQQALVKSAKPPPLHGFHKQKSTRDEGTQAVTRSAEMNPKNMKEISSKDMKYKGFKQKHDEHLQWCCYLGTCVTALLICIVDAVEGSFPVLYPHRDRFPWRPGLLAFCEDTI